MLPHIWNLKLLPDHSVCLMPLNEQAEKGVSLTRVVNSDHQEVIGLLLPYSGGKDENVWNIRNPLKYLLVLPHPMIKVDRKVQLNLSSAPNSPDPSGIKF